MKAKPQNVHVTPQVAQRPQVQSQLSQPPQQQPQQSPIDAATGCLESAIGSLRFEIELMAQKLNPVLRPSLPPAVGDTVACENDNGPHVNRLRDIRAAIDELHAAVAQLNDRVEV